MKKLFENKDKDLFEFIIYFLFIIRKSFIRTNTAKNEEILNTFLPNFNR
jgi:hypothetical protein